eukprot:GEMP01014466.1.p1 GENE.GEMP01014466.1~~GEMP01014466.1.p1  ORF type:complete len:432 (+),score=91.85 GEMP01014466.1:98-1393(+)
MRCVFFMDLAFVVVSAAADSDQHTLTVMNVNLFFIPVLSPAISTRVDEFNNWFTRLELTDVPDVLVFNEMWKDALIQKLCSHSYNSFSDTMTLCDNEGSYFHGATPGVNARHDRASWWQFLHGGITVLTKKSVTLEWTAEWDLLFDNVVSGEQFARKGAQLVKIRKNENVVYLLGTHLQSGASNAGTRITQIAQIVQHVQRYVPHDRDVVFSGDFNVEDADMGFLADTLKMNRDSVVRQDSGFWTLLEKPLAYSSKDGNGLEPPHIGPESMDRRYDWIFPATVNGARTLAPSTTSSVLYQYVPMEAPPCFFATTHLLSPYMIPFTALTDHHAVFAKICFNHQQCTYTGAPITLPRTECKDTYCLNDIFVIFLVLAWYGLLVMSCVCSRLGLCCKLRLLQARALLLPMKGTPKDVRRRTRLRKVVSRNEEEV